VSENQLAARIRNLFAVGVMIKRYDDDGRIQVETETTRVEEKKESHPYGFKALAAKGTVFVLCRGGNLDGLEFLPVIDAEGGPDLEPGDTAVYTASGAWIIARESGALELYGTDEGGLVRQQELKTQLAKMTGRIDGIMNALKSAPTGTQDGGAAYKAGIAAALNALGNKENFSDIASGKVFHGTG
jgi:phage gp45-like